MPRPPIETSRCTSVSPESDYPHQQGKDNPHQSDQEVDGESGATSVPMEAVARCRSRAPFSRSYSWLTGDVRTPLIAITSTAKARSVASTTPCPSFSGEGSLPTINPRITTSMGATMRVKKNLTGSRSVERAGLRTIV